jgi:hypothetical protein
VETHEAIAWLAERMVWERRLNELRKSYAGAGTDVENLAQRRQRRLPPLLTSDWWSRRSA